MHTREFSQILRPGKSLIVSTGVNRVTADMVIRQDVSGGRLVGRVA